MCYAAENLMLRWLRLSAAAIAASAKRGFVRTPAELGSKSNVRSGAGSGQPSEIVRSRLRVQSVEHSAVH